jgi:hypothetical protein
MNIAILEGNSVVIPANVRVFPNGGYKHLLIKHTHLGTIDTTFGDNGIATPPGPALITNDIKVPDDGKFVTEGNSDDPENTYLGFGIARFNVDGSLGTNFGNNGMTVTDVRPGNDAIQ